MSTRVAPQDWLRVQDRIRTRASSFDIGALLLLLRRIDISREDIIFKSNPDPVSGPGIVQAVEFFDSPDRRAEVTLNLGFTGPNGLVPSYFQEIARDSRDPDVMETFLQFFDHPMLSALVDALYPEHPTGALRSWSSLRNATFSMLGVGSIATLEWIMSQVFPELRLRVSRASIPMPTDAYALHAGVALLDGSGVLGVVDAPQSCGLRVDLFAEEEETAAGRKWIDVVDARLRHVALPLVQPYDLTLRIVFNVLEHASWAHLEEPPEGEEVPEGHLGYDRIEGGEGGHQVVVFEGLVHRAVS